jgi:hypothetical protein
LEPAQVCPATTSGKAIEMPTESIIHKPILPYPEPAWQNTPLDRGALRKSLHEYGFAPGADIEMLVTDHLACGKGARTLPTDGSSSSSSHSVLLLPSIVAPIVLPWGRRERKVDSRFGGNGGLGIGARVRLILNSWDQRERTMLSPLMRIEN